ncbi:MAG TPA: DUF3182 family protein [Ideonella sp.]|uniref:DUF3182 family protein n=1 Tax=Ideonella sp. TaxID=1929293 RepID=UPI002E3143E2|nr:DUF3182 family protein [Ideonella sp.]HEX5686431.1 DUF3182 family protein [Ideonella sp.]
MITALAAPRTPSATRSRPRNRPRPVKSAAPAVAFFRSNGQTGPLDHDASSKCRVAESLALLLGHEFVGELDLAHPPTGSLYLVPTDTLPSLVEAQRLGISRPDQLFGGVVPQPFVATKVISHPLVAPGACSVPGWSAAYGEQVRDAVLPGYSVFSADDARLAARCLFEDGSVRLKDPAGVGGVGQWVIDNLDELDARLAAFGLDNLSRHGLVLERNLSQVITHSVGLVSVGSHVASYFGTQSLTRNHRDHEVYGGSQLTVCRGGFEVLLKQTLAPDVRTAVEQALTFHRAASACFPGFFASRCNYDVAQGVDGQGRALSGVLEQSWRIGGASGAEAAALHAFAADPSLRRIRASTCEVYADEFNLPRGAWLLYDGPDNHGGRLIKYAQVTPDVDA